MRYDKCLSSFVFKEPNRRINENYIKLDTYLKQLENSIKAKFERETSKFSELTAKLDAYSPLKTLSRGYTILEKDGKFIKSKEELKSGDIVNIKLFDGNKKAQIQ